MDKRELEAYNQAIKDKYKHHTLWKVLAIIFMITTAVFGVLYFATGDLFKQTTNEVEVVNNNEGDSSTNNNSVTINN